MAIKAIEAGDVLIFQVGDLKGCSRFAGVCWGMLMYAGGRYCRAAVALVPAGWGCVYARVGGSHTSTVSLAHSRRARASRLTNNSQCTHLCRHWSVTESHDFVCAHSYALGARHVCLHVCRWFSGVMSSFGRFHREMYQVSDPRPLVLKYLTLGTKLSHSHLILHRCKYAVNTGEDLVYIYSWAVWGQLDTDVGSESDLHCPRSCGCAQRFGH